MARRDHGLDQTRRLLEEGLIRFGLTKPELAGPKKDNEERIAEMAPSPRETQRVAYEKTTQPRLKGFDLCTLTPSCSDPG